jgi:hypothetical protein
MPRPASPACTTASSRIDEDTLLLQGPRGETLLELRYVDDWYPSTDGAGRSLVAVDPRGPLEAWKDATGWRESLAEGGSPGVAEDGQPSGGWQLAGDWNQDGHRNVSDPIRLLARLFGGFTGALPCDGSLESGGNLVLHDSTGDGKVDLADAVHLLTYLFRAGDPPFVGAECCASRVARASARRAEPCEGAFLRLECRWSSLFAVAAARTTLEASWS